MLGHTPLRLYVLGEEAAERDASEPEIEEMRRLVADALDAGAIGFASSRQAFEGNKAETRTMLPVITAFMTAHQLADVTVVADAGMISEANQHAIEDAGLSLHPRHPYCRGALRRRSVAPRAPRPGPPRRADLHPALAGHCGAESARPPGQGHLLPVPRRSRAARRSVRACRGLSSERCRA